MNNFYPFEEDMEQCLLTLSKGGTILYPTDTVWGIGCDATCMDAVNKVYQIKNRPQNNPFIILVHSEAMLLKYVDDVPEIAYDLIEASVTPLTIIFPKGKNLANNVIGQDGSIAIRIVHEPFCKTLIATFKKPIVSTSANISTFSAPLFFSEINQEIIHAIDYVVKYRQKDNTHIPPSSIVKVFSDNTVQYIRK